MLSYRIASDSSERITAEEVAYLRRRIIEGQGVVLGADATLDEVAEAFDLSTDDVRRHLESIREERALRTEASPRKDQRGLLALGIVLLLAAYPIHLLNPRKLTNEERLAEMEAKLADVRARKKAHPVVHYPIFAKVRSGPLPPAGFSLKFTGPLTELTVASGSTVSGPVDAAATRSGLIDAVFNAYSVARDAERKAPKPDHPLPSSPNSRWTGGLKPTTDTLVYTLDTGGSQSFGSISIEPPSGFSAARWEDEARRRIAESVDGVMRSLSEQQARSLVADSRFGAPWQRVPAGYSITFEGDQNQISTGQAGVVVLPYDASKVAARLRDVIRELVWRDAEPPDFETAQGRAARAKKAVPSYANVILSGPRGIVRFRLPMNASPEYPNAAAAARAADGLIAAAARKAAAQVGPVGDEVKA